MRTCAQASSIRAMPENEIPPAMRVDIYLFILKMLTKRDECGNGEILTSRKICRIIVV